jgi:hypothetical protein
MTDQEAREGGARAVVLLGRQARNSRLAGMDQRSAIFIVLYMVTLYFYKQ